MSLTGICFGYYFLTLEIFYPCAYTILCFSFIFFFSIRIKEPICCYCLLLILCISNSTFLMVSGVTGKEVPWGKKIPFQRFVHGRLKSTAYLDLSGSRLHRSCFFSSSFQNWIIKKCMF